MKTSINLTAVEKLTSFVNQRPGLEFANYGDRKLYSKEMREITADRRDFYELLGLASRRVSNLNEVLETELKRSSNRLTMNENGNLEYCTGQYFPTEYRPAASRILANIIWSDYRDEKDAQGQPIYKDGHEMRKAIRRNVGRRVASNYFN